MDKERTGVFAQVEGLQPVDPALLAEYEREMTTWIESRFKSKPQDGPNRASWLLVPEFFKLDWCCRSFIEAFGAVPYLVGSCLQKRDFRDVDVSLMLPDEQFDRMFLNKYTVLFFNAVVSAWLKSLTGLPIDFKFQDHTKTNEQHPGPRNPIGCRSTSFAEQPPR